MIPKFKITRRNVSVTFLVVSIIFSAELMQLGFALTPIQITVNSAKIIGTNNFQTGFQVEGSDLYIWTSRSEMKQLTADANFGIVRIFNYIVEPCTRWYESTKTGTWDWSKADALVRRIAEVGAEPLICLGFYSWESNGIRAPSGMTKNPTTGLPYASSWAAYCAEWVKHFKQAGLTVRYYEMINEVFQYWKDDGWPTAQPKLGYFMELYNAAAKAMRAQNPNVKLGNDASIMKGVLDYFISNGENLDFLSYHGYGTSSLSASDSEILNAAETKYIGESSSYYGVDKARQLYKDKKGIDLPVIKSENNVDYTYSSGTDPRIQTMVGAVYHALTFRTFMLKNYAYNIYFHYASSASSEQRKQSGGAGFGMVNSDDNKPWYPYYAHKMLGQNLAVGDKIVESTSSSEDARVIAWINNKKLNVLLICKVGQTTTVQLSGLQGSLNFSKIDNTISWKTPSIQSGALSSTSLLTMNGYTVMLLQGAASATPPPPSPVTLFEDSFESGDFSKWTGTSVSTGDTSTIVNLKPHHGTYNGRFASDTSSSSEYAYCYKSIDNSEIFARGYVYVASGLSLSHNDDRFYFIRLRTSTESPAAVGIRRNGGVDKWVIYVRDGSGLVRPFYATSPTINMNQWYCIELHWKKDASQGLAELYVNGIKILQATSIDTSYYGNAAKVDFGLISDTDTEQTMIIYGDCFKLSSTYIGVES